MSFITPGQSIAQLTERKMGGGRWRGLCLWQVTLACRILWEGFWRVKPRDVVSVVIITVWLLLLMEWLILCPWNTLLHCCPTRCYRASQQLPLKGRMARLYSRHASTYNCFSRDSGFKKKPAGSPPSIERQLIYTLHTHTYGTQWLLENINADWVSIFFLLFTVFLVTWYCSVLLQPIYWPFVHVSSGYMDLDLLTFVSMTASLIPDKYAINFWGFWNDNMHRGWLFVSLKRKSDIPDYKFDLQYHSMVYVNCTFRLLSSFSLKLRVLLLGVQTCYEISAGFSPSILIPHTNNRCPITCNSLTAELQIPHTRPSHSSFQICEPDPPN